MYRNGYETGHLMIGEGDHDRAAAGARREQRGDAVGAAKLKAVSSVAWTHVNFYGRSIFSEEPAAVPIDGFVETMRQYAFQVQTSEETVDH